ncbi:MAG TPA: hypothetical protein DD381_12385 [Lentisphaeria bacterium]|nr:MAG: hypothetical protein A2X47_09355 [Lentisphaerae bacterium GWF2_38_69]HBM17124.1 hypothetical protein [Lentisphaeria bacterium]
MTATAILLIICSAIIHALWNLLCKKSNSTAAFFLIASCTSCIILLPFIAYSFRLVISIPLQVWILLAITGLFQSLYYSALAKAYKHGEISVAYPVARTLPVVLVALIVYVISGGREALSHESMFGVLLIAFGCIMLPMQHLRDFRFKNYLNISCLFSVLAAVGTTGYSIIDDYSMELLKIHFSKTENIAFVSLMYIFIETLFTFIWLGMFVRGNREERASLKAVCKESKLSAIITGVGITLSYSMILMAMTFAANVSYVVAFRQMGIFIGALLGIIFLREAIKLPKALGLCLLLIGLLLIALGT